MTAAYHKRQKNLQITEPFLAYRERDSRHCQAWIAFCRTLLAEGYTLSIIESKSTSSKYITVRQPPRTRYYIVRFGDHLQYDNSTGKSYDFCVGMGLYTTGTVEQALAAVREHFRIIDEEELPPLARRSKDYAHG